MELLRYSHFTRNVYNYSSINTTCTQHPINETRLPKIVQYASCKYSSLVSANSPPESKFISGAPPNPMTQLPDTRL
jgi:hypothetical protein